MELAEAEAKKQILQPIKVLIADDDAPTRILLRAAISQWGYEVTEAADGEEAWDLLQKDTTQQLMIVDWLMPRLDGIDLCRRIKHELNYHPYIILLTQLSGTTNIIKGLEAGANEFLSKPFNMAELQSRLSVGSRIVRYQNSLAAKNVRLQEYCSKMSELSNIINNMVAKSEEMNRLLLESEKNSNNDAQTNRLKELQTDFKNMMEIIKALNEGQSQDGND